MAFAVSDWLTVLCLSNTAPPLKFSGGAGVEGREIESLLRDDCPEFLLSHSRLVGPIRWASTSNAAITPIGSPPVPDSSIYANFIGLLWLT